MVCHDFFDAIPEGTKDEMNEIKTILNNDSFKSKVDVSAGVYRDETGIAYELPCIKQSKKVLYSMNPSHDYNFTTGISEFNSMAAKITFGDEIAMKGSIATCQTISGTGACNIAIKFLKLSCGIDNYYVGLPTWPNYLPMIKSIGGNVTTYEYYNSKTRQINMDLVLDNLNKAEETNSAFVFQLCCHNPTATDFTMDQWEQIANVMASKKIIPIFDTAYQGLSSGSLEDDRAPIELFYNKGLQFLVCQSFSKNLGLYSERVGAVHVVCFKGEEPMVKDQLRSIIRREFSSASAYGARLAVLVDKQFGNEWADNLNSMAKRLKSTRARLYKLLNDYGLEENFDHLLTQAGMFWYTGYSKQVCQKLIENHIYLPSNGRVNIAGLNDDNIEYFAKCLIDALS